MNAKVTVVVLLLGGMVGPAVASAQDGSLTRNARVRVVAPMFSTSPSVGSLAGLDSTGLRLVQGQADTVFIPRDAVMSLDVSAGRRSHWVRGAAIGGLSGMALATVLWIADNADEEDDPLGNALNDMFYPAAAVLLGGTGALVGGVIGAIARTEQWDRVPASEIHWTVAPMAGGARVGLSLSF